ncbi:MAG: hypothetical protein JWO06_2803 [Bacteroidota bacterium]|nr:hypothetical protein [Bacteroidota bacterium]
MLLLACLALRAQLYDAQWVIGPNTSVVDFRTIDSVHTYTISRSMATTFTNACISSDSGELLYYTNGIFISDKNGDTLSNGTGLSPCPYTTQYEINGLNIPQAALFIPMPGNNQYFYLFHFSNDTLNDGRPGTLYYSIIDKMGNGGLGEVVQKNVVYYKGIFRAGGMTACKHANGRDWWIIQGGRSNNTYYKFLLTPEGIIDTLIQNIGPNYNGPFDVASGCFSPDGGKYATSTLVGLITVMDFDRCSGEFSLPITISNIQGGSSASGAVSVGFSPNGRFLYVSERLYLTQYELSNIHDSVNVYIADSADFAQIDFVQLAANGKMYGSTWNGGFYFLHVIDYPDSLGNSCHFGYGKQPTLSDNSVNLPNLPNYKLGPLIGSGCDTINTSSANLAKEAELIRIIPNPANKYAYVEIGTPGDYEFQLLNETGQLITSKQTKQVDIFDTENLASGVYFLKVVDRKNTKKTITRKIVVQH